MAVWNSKDKLHMKHWVNKSKITEIMNKKKYITDPSWVPQIHDKAMCTEMCASNTKHLDRFKSSIICWTNDLDS